MRRRHQLGQDLFDEMWEGIYHMAPAPHSRHSRVAAELTRVMLPLAQGIGLLGLDPFNLGEPDDYRVPDHGWVYEVPDATYLPTAAIVVEVLSPDDETFDKLPFYAAMGSRSFRRRSHGAPGQDLLFGRRTLRGARRERSTWRKHRTVRSSDRLALMPTARRRRDEYIRLRGTCPNGQTTIVGVVVSSSLYGTENSVQFSGRSACCAHAAHAKQEAGARERALLPDQAPARGERPPSSL